MKKKRLICRFPRESAAKILLKMKLFTLLVLLSFAAASAKTYSQQAKLSLDMTDATITEIFQKIEENSEFILLYNEGSLDLERRISLKLTNKNVDQVLNEVFKGTKNTYKIYDRQIVILAPGVTEVPAMFSNKSEQPQERTISGIVKDADGGSIPGVSIIVDGTTIGIVSDSDGNFELKIPGGAEKLIFSFVGMKTQEVLIGSNSYFEVVMESEHIGLEEVIAVGYGTQKKATITGSVTSVKGQDLKQVPAVNVSNTLVGRLPGVIAVNRSGEPGYDGSDIYIRGSNTLNDNAPLIVVDGVAGRSMNRIDPADIESVSVLKDASAAIYGARAANGVILITTKRGKVGKPTITVNINQGLSQPTRIPDMADAASYAQAVNEINQYRGRDPKYTEQDLQYYRDGSQPWTHPNTDWFAETFKTWASQQYANFSVSGGTEAMKYYVSLGANYQDGIYKNSATNYSQYDFRSNLDGKVSDNIHFAIDISGRQENRNFPTRGAGNIFRMLMRGKPNLPAYWPDGTPGPDIEYGDNPVVITTDETGYDRDKWYVFDSNMKLDVNIPWIPGLKATANLAIDKRIRNRKLWQKGWYLYSWDFETYDDKGNPSLIKGLKGFTDPQLTQQMEDNQNITINGLLNYEHTFNNNDNIKILLGIERFEGDKMDFEAFRRFFVSDIVDQLFAGGDEEKTNTGSASQSARLNYFGRFNYNMKNKYLAEFVWRYDGSDIFPKDSRWGFFPGISIGWRISEENFWKNNLPFIEDFKIRGSWGQTGNDRIDPYQFLATYEFNSDRTYIFGGTDNKRLNENVIPNPNVTWEIANQTNIGFDGQTLNGKLYFEADYFYNLRTDILIERNASVPNSTGLTLPPENIAEVINQGFEFLFTYRDRKGDFNYAVSLNGGYQHNEIKFWDETPGIPDYQKSTGHPMETDLYYQAIGIFKDEAHVNSLPHWANARPGDIIFEDVNKDGKIDGLDRKRSYKNDLPKFQGGLALNMSYKNFDLNVLFQGAAGAVQYVGTESGDIGNFLNYYLEDRWTETNTDASKPRVSNRSEEYWRGNDNTFFLRSTDYIRLKNAELGYSLSPSVTKKLGVDVFRVYLSALNLFTLDKFKVYDPEMDNAAGTNYIQNRVINLGVTLTF